MRKELRRRGITDLTVVYSLEVPVEPAGVPAADNGRHPPASMAFVPPAAGFLMASYAVRDLLGPSASCRTLNPFPLYKNKDRLSVLTGMDGGFYAAKTAENSASGKNSA